jgi:polar amino acid transport system permease protein
MASTGNGRHTRDRQVTAAGSKPDLRVSAAPFEHLLADQMLQLSTTRPVPLRHPGRWAACAAVAVLLVCCADAVVTNPNFQWPVVGAYLFNVEILHGVLVTIYLTASCMCIGIVLGVVLALMRQSDNKLLEYSAHAYIVVFRGTPALVQLIFWFNLAVLFPTIAIGLPFVGVTLLSVKANAVITPFIAANLGLGLCEAAFMAEIVRAGVRSVDPGQAEAAAALGLTRAQSMRRIVLPQALRVIIPPTGNEVIGMLKYTSLASVISVTETLTAAELIYTRNFETIPLLIVASIWYLVLTTVLTGVQRLLERWAGRSEIDARHAVSFARAVRENLLPTRLVRILHV